MARGAKRAAVEAGPVEGPWELPTGWRWERLGNLCSYVSRGRGPKYVASDGVRVVNQRCVRWDGVDLSYCKRTDALAAQRLPSEQFLRDGDILWNSTGTGTIGRAAIFRSDGNEPFVADSHVTIVRLSNTDPCWVHHWIGTYAVQQVVAGTGSTNQVELGREVVLNLPVPCAEPTLQQATLRRVEELFAEIDEGERALAEVDNGERGYRLALLAAAVRGELTTDFRGDGGSTGRASERLEGLLNHRRSVAQRLGVRRYVEPIPPASASLGELPPGWVWMSLDQLSSPAERSFQSGPFGSSLLHSEFRPTGKLVIGIDNVQDGYFSAGSNNRIADAKFQDLRRFQARPRDVVITVMATIGRTCVLPDDIEEAIITKHLYRITVNEAVADPHFVNMCLRGRAETRSAIFGNTQGQTRPGLNKAILQRVPVPVPALEEQREIVRRVDRAWAALDKAVEQRRQAADTVKLRQSILAAAFRGDLVA